MRVVFETLGCRLNQFETDALEQATQAAGHDVVSDPAAADVYVLNGCTITHQADADARQRIRRAHRKNPAVRVIVTGCSANADPQGLAAMPGVAAVVGNADKASLVDLIPGLRAEAPDDGTLPHVAVSSLTRRMGFVPLSPALRPRRTRAMLKVQDGCNYRCAFCIVPQVRGGSRSLAIDACVTQLKALVAAGVPEVVLTGIHLGTYGRDLRPRATVTDLVAALIPHLGPARLRLSSIDPHEVDDALLDLIGAHPDAICRHLHLPVQSGDPDTLRRMRRGHTAQAFAELAQNAARRIPGIAIGSDVIVGFPGEDDAAFERTRALLAGLPMSYLHVFSYSIRHGTAAAHMPDQVPGDVKAARNRVLRGLSRAKTAAFRKAAVGTAVDAVIQRHKNGQLRALTDHYLEFPVSGALAAGRRATVRIRGDGTAIGA